jgi:PadR family transcriptional regulator, regulatory protein PadR
MAEASTDVVQGTLDMLILRSLRLEPMHGFGVARRIEQVSDGVFRVNPGSLLVAFQRLERDGLVDSEWRATDNNRQAKFYRLTRKGRRRLERDTREWARRSAAIARLMET